MTTLPTYIKSEAHIVDDDDCNCPAVFLGGIVVGILLALSFIVILRIVL